MLEQPYPDEPADTATVAECRAYEKHYNDSLDVSCLLLAMMHSEL